MPPVQLVRDVADDGFILPADGPDGYTPDISVWVKKPTKAQPGRGDWQDRPMDEDEQAFVRSFIGEGAPEGFNVYIRVEGGMRCNFYNGSRGDLSYPHSLAMLDSLCERHVLNCSAGWTTKSSRTYAVSLDYTINARFLAGLVPQQVAL